MAKKKINLLTVLVIAIFIAITIYFISGVVNILKLEHEERTLEERNKELQVIRDELLLEYDSVKSKDYLENEARSKLKLVRPEELIILYNDNDE